MKKNNRPIIKMDERNKQVAYQVIAIMYFLTLMGLNALLIYRQFALGQEIGEFKDLAIMLSVNSLFLISALLYFGAVSIQKISIWKLLLIYLGIVILGALFIYAKYNIFQSPGLSFHELANKMLIVAAVCGLMILFFIIMSLLGKRKLNKAIEE